MEHKTVLGSEFQSLSVELGFWIPILSGIPDSLSCIPNSKANDSRFNKHNFPGFRIPQAKMSNSWIPKSGFPFMGRKENCDFFCPIWRAVLTMFARLFRHPRRPRSSPLGLRNSLTFVAPFLPDPAWLPLGLPRLTERDDFGLSKREVKRRPR